ncbi:MAG: porin family protein [Syntrophorhabdaceae bacterium]|nr:porin family protein [Syntrophorhabdaceae bacterium]
MRKAVVLSTALVVMAVLAGAAFAAEYDRYERGYTREEPSSLPPPPPPASSSPPRAAAVPPQTHMNYGPGYVGVQLGFYEPNDDWRDGLATYNTGFAFNVIFGNRLTPFFAVEGSVGYFGSKSNVYDGDLSVLPLTVGGRLIIPNPVVEPYIGAGLGIYFASLDEKRGVKDDTADLGGYMSFGMDFWLTPRVALNMEGRYHWIKSRFEGFNVDLSGWNALMGVRVLF